MVNLDYKDEQLPYDPSDVDIRKQSFVIDSVMNLIKTRGIELWREEDYQRKGNSWNIRQKSRLIESLIMRIPLPIFYFDGSDFPWKIIDGIHRLTTLFTYIVENKWGLEDLQYLKRFEGYYFKDLPFKYQRAIFESTIEAYIINPGTPDRVKLNIFQRINTGGSSLSRQEIRNAYYRGVPVNFLNSLANSKEFLETTRCKISQKLMKDKEIILRFIAFYNFMYEYEQPLERFLDFTMEKLYNLGEELGELEKKFLQSMRLCNIIFGDNAFYVLDKDGEKLGSRINVALFEAWSVSLAKVTKNEVNIIINCRREIFSNFVELLSNIEFYKSITTNTSSKKAVTTRFFEIEKIIKNVLDVN